MVRDRPPFKKELQDTKADQQAQKRAGKILKGKQTYKCPYDGCGKEFGRRDRLKAHMYLHTG